MATIDMAQTVARFLGKWGIEPNSLVRHAPAVADNECLAIMGSIAEGLANEQSDIDLLYLGDGELRDKVVLTFADAYKFGVSHDENGREINVEQIRLAELDTMAERASSSLQAVYEPLKAKGAVIERNINKLRMMHRVGNCVPLVNPHVLEAWQKKLRTDELHVFLCQNHVEALMNQQEDIVGELDAGNVESAFWMVRSRFLPSLIAAMLTSIGETNQQSKWHYNLLLRHRDDLGPARVDAVSRLLTASQQEFGADLARHVMEIAQPAIDDVLARQRDVRRSVAAFSHLVRYNSLKEPKRWQATSA